LDVEEKIKRYVAEKLQTGSSERLEADDSLFEAGVLDSVGIFDLVTYLEGEFGVEIGDEQIVPENFESIGAITRFVHAARDGS